MTSSNPTLAKKIDLELVKKRIARTGLKITPHVITLLSDREIAELSKRFRGKKRATDVLAFSYGDASMPDEVIISADTAKRQAKERGIPIEDELTLLCLHGILHNMGYEDESLDEWKKMKKKEFELLMRILE